MKYKVIKTTEKILMCIVAIMMTGCSSSFQDKVLDAYGESTKELVSAQNDKDCDKVYDKLMNRLFVLSLEYPNWETLLYEDLDKGEKIENAAKTWEKALSNATTFEHYNTLLDCNFNNSIVYKENQNPALLEDYNSNDADEAYSE